MCSSDLITFPLTFNEDDNNENNNIGFYEKSELKLNKLRIFYVFSSNSNLNKFFGNESLIARIIKGNDGEEIAVGNGNILADLMSYDYINTCIKHNKTILLFKKSTPNETLKLRINFGIIKDKKVDASRIQMKAYGTYSVYFPVETYVTPEPFPIEWIEIFDVNIYMIG